MPAVNEYGTILSLRLLDKTHNSIDDILVNNVLNVGFGPIEGQKTHAFDDGVIM